MIQWCEDCKHSPWDGQSCLTMTEKALEICDQCLDNSKPGEQPIEWEKREKNDGFILS